MGSISVACYKPKPDCEAALLELVRGHLPPLRTEGLVTDRASIVMRAADGTIIEIFEWVLGCSADLNPPARGRMRSKCRRERSANDHILMRSVPGMRDGTSGEMIGGAIGVEQTVE